MCWSHYTTPPQVFRASLTRGKSSCIWYGVMRPRARPLNIIILLWSGGILVMGGLYKFEGKMFDIRGKNSGVYNFSSEKENQQAIIPVWFEVPVGVSSYNYVQFKYSDVCFCVFLSSVRWGGFGANFDSERMSPTSRPSLSFW